MNRLVLLLSICILNSIQVNGEDLEVCWPHRENTLCSDNVEQQCSSSQQCSINDEICCRYECGTICLAKDRVVREREPLVKCWQFNSTAVNCLRYDVMCESNSDCGANQICCAHECGRICRDNALVDNHNQRIKRDTTCGTTGSGLSCTMPKFQCHTNDDCSGGLTCCSYPCSSVCKQM